MSAAESNLPPASSVAAWRILLRGAGVLIALFVFCFWAAKGYHGGWTKTQIPVTQVDPVTEIEFVTYEKGFVPGVDYLGGGIFAGVVVFAVTFWPRRGPNPPRA